jgi:DNA invertase Pin-like site-specific DNA recombinase
MHETPSKARCLGYARVSTYGHTLDAQLEQLRAHGCNKIYREKASGARADRRELPRLLKALAPGDTVTVTPIDRLARSTLDLSVRRRRVDIRAVIAARQRIGGMATSRHAHPSAKP